MIGRQQRCYFVVDAHCELVIGDNVGMSSTAIICQNKISIGNNVRIGGGTVIYDTDFHSLSYKERISIPEDVSGIKAKEVFIDDNVFIGAHSMILKGVVIGRNAIVGAGSVVTKSIPENEIWAGNPAKFIRTIVS
jgi:acetyltransferase-like isoleucine patch superfamily enzyme